MTYNKTCPRCDSENFNIRYIEEDDYIVVICSDCGNYVAIGYDPKLPDGWNPVTA